MEARIPDPPLDDPFGELEYIMLSLFLKTIGVTGASTTCENPKIRSVVFNSSPVRTDNYAFKQS